MSNNLKIPKSFSIFGQDITVNFDDMLRAKMGCLGVSRYRENQITLQSDMGIDFCDDERFKIFLHEAVHMMLSKLSYFELTEDEDFVERMAMAIHQLLKTSKY